MDGASFAEELLAFWLRDHPEISEWDCATAPVPAATDARSAAQIDHAQSALWCRDPDRSRQRYARSGPRRDSN